MPPTDLLSVLLNLVRAAAREDSTQAVKHHDAPPTRPAPLLVDKRALAHALGVSTATVDRMGREGRIPYVHVSDLRLFDIETVRAALRAAARSASRDVAGSAPLRMVETRLVAEARRPRRLGMAPS
ncbi:MAG: hypothetical protein ACLP1X_07820 [Polyangiaceae bacterium]|jgi:hypothetical protein